MLVWCTVPLAEFSTKYALWVLFLIVFVVAFARQRYFPSRACPPNHAGPYGTELWRQATYLNASASTDDDGIAALPMVYTWNCVDESGSACVSPSRDTLDLSSMAAGGLLSIPGGALPVGEESATCVR